MNNRDSLLTDSLLAPFFKESVDRFILPNGLTVIFKEDHSAELVSVQVWVKTGSMDEAEKTGAGVSHFLEHMVFKGSEQREGPELSAAITRIGGQLNAYTSFDRTVYYADVPSEGSETAFDVLSDLVFRAKLEQEDYEKEREVILREIDMAFDEPDRQVSRAIFRTVFRNHPFGHPVLGHRDLFLKVSVEDLRHYYTSRYVPNNMVVVVAGDINRDALDSCLERYFSGAERKALPMRFIPEEPAQLAPREERMSGSVNICRGAIAFRIPGINHADSVALDLLAAVLGGGESSILYQSLRERNELVHSISASCWNPGDSGIFWISYTCEPDKQEAVESAIQDELARVSRQGIHPDDLQKARRQAIVGEINARKTISAQASRLGLAEVVVGDLEYPKSYFKLLQTVHFSDIPRLILTYLIAESRTIVSLNQELPERAQRSVKGKTQLSNFELITLPNGAKIVYQQDTGLPKVHIRYTGLGGPLYEDKSNAGITGLLATQLLRDTKNRSAEQVARLVESRGGIFHEFVGNNAFGFGIEMLSEDVITACNLIEDALLHPLFSEATFERERNAQIAQLNEDMDDIVECGRKRLRKHFFGDHPYGCDSYGTVEALKSLNAQSVKEHALRLLLSSNSVISICGNFDPDKVLPELEAILSVIPDYAFEKESPPFTPPTTAQSYREQMEREQSVVLQAFAGPAINTEDYYTANVIEELLNDMSGRLFLHVREELGLAYYVGAYRMTGLHTGMFNLMAGTKPGHEDAVLDVFTKELTRLKEGDVSDADLAHSRLRLLSQTRFAHQAIGSRAVNAGLNCLFGVDINNWNNHKALLERVSRESIARFASEYLDPAKAISLIVGPEK